MECPDSRPYDLMSSGLVGHRIGIRPRTPHAGCPATASALARRCWAADAGSCCAADSPTSEAPAVSEDLFSCRQLGNQSLRRAGPSVVEGKPSEAGTARSLRLHPAFDRCLMHQV